MSDQCVRSNVDVSGVPAGVDSARQLCLLKYDQVQLGLGHPLQGQLQSAVLAVSDIISPKPYWLPPPHITSINTAHPLPTYSFRPSLPIAHPAHYGVSLYLFTLLFCPLWPYLSVPALVPNPIPVPVPVPVILFHSLLHAVQLGVEYSVAL